MSGGAWQYQSGQMEEAAERAYNGARLLAAIEHELDWGVSADTCLACAMRRVVVALCALFEGYASDDVPAPTEIMRARNVWEMACPRCLANHPSLFTADTEIGRYATDYVGGVH